MSYRDLIANTLEAKLNDWQHLATLELKRHDWLEIIDALREPKSAQPENVAKDAARYQWLRTKHSSGDGQAFVYGANDDLDAYIDAAMSADVDKERT